MNYIQLAKEKEELCIKIRRDLHKIPELELNLPKTVNYIKNLLMKWNIEYDLLVNGNAIVARVYGKEGNKCLAIRADMDALPITEETDLPYKSIHEGKMHACGHDGHMSMALVACKILSENTDKFNGCVKFLFQPGEEIPGGAKLMIEEGCMKNPDVDYIIGLHEGGLIDELNTGEIGFKCGSLMASMDKFEITVHGKGGHGAHPEDCVDSIVIMSEIILGIQKIVSREVSPTSQAVISCCKINGGTTQNIIPDNVSVLGTARALDEKTQDLIEKRLREISCKIAEAYNATAEVNYTRYYPVLINDYMFTEDVFDIATSLFGKEYVKRINTPTMGGEDMSLFLKEVPGTYFMLTNLKTSSDGIRYPHHSSKFDVIEDEFYKGIAIFVAVAINKLNIK